MATVAAAQSGSLESTRTDSFNCVARPKSLVELGSPEQGILAELLVDRGDEVGKGEVVARLDSELQELALEMNKLKASADVEIRSSEARLNFRQTEAQRARSLHDRNVVATAALDEAAIEGVLAELALETARLEHSMAQIELKQAKARRDRRSVRSPVDGIVVETAAEVGEYISEQKHIMKIAEIDPLHVEVYVPVAHYGTVELGMKTLVEMDQPIGGEYEATVTVVDHVFDAESRTFGVRLELPNPDLKLPAGMVCRVRFLSGGAGLKGGRAG